MLKWLLLIILIVVVVWVLKKRYSQNAYYADIEKETLTNEKYRNIAYTTPDMQLVYMKLNEKQQIGEEEHNGTQFIRVEEGNGKAIIDKKEFELKPNSVVIIPPNTLHNIIADTSMKLYTLYSPPQH